MEIHTGFSPRVVWQTLKAGAMALILAVMSFWLDLADIIRQKIFLRARSLPPGPPRYPIVGSLLSIRSGLPQEALAKLAKHYGPMMLMYFGNKRTLVVSNAAMCCAVFKEHDEKLSMRPPLHEDKSISRITDSIFAYASYGPEWRFFRRLSHTEIVSPSRINQFKEKRHQLVMDLVHTALEASKLNSFVTMRKPLSTFTFANIGEMLLDKSYFRESAAEMREAYNNIFQASGILNVADYFPVIKPFLFESCKGTLTKSLNKINALYDIIIAKRRKEFLARKEGEPLETVLDVLLSRAQEPDAKQYLTQENIRKFLTEMFLGGADTTGNTVEWMLLRMMKHPRVMKRAQEEVDAVVGRDRLVSESDIPHLSYIQAIVKETLRLHLPGAFLIPHFTKEDIKIGGYDVPANTPIYVNAWAVHRDPDSWERPLEFHPERFLTPDSTTALEPDAKTLKYVPFGAGRRTCVGKQFGAVVMYHCIAELVHAIDWSLADGENPENIDVSTDKTDIIALGVVKAGVQLRVVAKPRLPMNVIYQRRDSLL